MMAMTQQIPTADMPRQLGGLSEVIDAYDGVILDLWGVVHNGVAPFSPTMATLAALKAAGKTVWLLSNAPRRMSVVAAQLADMGIDSALYDGLLTSGEASHMALKNDLLAKWGQRCFLVGQAYGQCLLDGLDAHGVADLADADFILATGVPGGTLAANTDMLAAARARNLPMLCANPDRVVHVGEELYLCPGTLADHYETLGGTVVWFGKPYASVYDHVLAQMLSRRVLAVGDGMATDVKGALAAGIDMALVTAGIHRESLFGATVGAGEIAMSVKVAENRLAALIAREGAKPSFIINGLSW